MIKKDKETIARILSRHDVATVGVCILAALAAIGIIYMPLPDFQPPSPARLSQPYIQKLTTSTPEDPSDTSHIFDVDSEIIKQCKVTIRKRVAVDTIYVYPKPEDTVFKINNVATIKTRGSSWQATEGETNIKFLENYPLGEAYLITNPRLPWRQWVMRIVTTNPSNLLFNFRGICYPLEA